MGFFDSLFGGSGPTPKKIEAATSALCRRHGEAALRYGAAEKLAEWGTAEAVEGLLRRFTVTVENETKDDEEKLYVAELVEKFDNELLVPAIEASLRHSPSVAWAIKILAKKVAAEEFRTRVSKVLAQLDVHFDRDPQRKVQLIRALMDHAEDEAVVEAVLPFMDDTDDTVRMVVVEFVATSSLETKVQLLVDTLLESDERPRVKDAVLRSMVEHELAVAGRKAEVEPLLTEGYYLTNKGAVKRLGK